MKRDFSVIVRNYDGHPIVRNIGKYDPKTGLPVLGPDGRQELDRQEAMTLRTYALDALAFRWQGEEAITYEESSARAALMDRIATTEGPVEISAKEATMILDAMVRQRRDHFVIARMHAMLNTDPA